MFLTVGMAVYMLLIPYAEAAEQTILQQVVPYERQGRVFGFAQSVEQAASPLTAFLIGPIAQLVFIPFMTDGAGADAIGGWFGTGPDRGMALVFVLTGVIGLIVTVLALQSRFYRQLSDRYAQSPEPAEADTAADEALRLRREQGAVGRDRVGVLVVEPDATLAEVAELDPASARRARVRSSSAFPVRFRAEDSPRGLWRSLGKRVGFTPSRVRIPHPPPLPTRGNADSRRSIRDRLERPSLSS